MGSGKKYQADPEAPDAIALILRGVFGCEIASQALDAAIETVETEVS